MQQMLPNGRFTACPGKVPKEVTASSEDDPDLWMWEMLFFGLTSHGDIGQYSGLVPDPTGWLARMRARGFGDPTRVKTYPTFTDQKRAENQQLAKLWGGASRRKDAQLWTRSSLRKWIPTAGTLAANHKGRRSATAHSTGNAAAQTEKLPSTHHANLQQRTGAGTFKNQGKVSPKRKAQQKRSAQRARADPLTQLEKTLVKAKKELDKAKRARSAKNPRN